MYWDRMYMYTYKGGNDLKNRLIKTYHDGEWKTNEFKLDMNDIGHILQYIPQSEAILFFQTTVVQIS
jgi:hypothetical protein